MVCVMLLQPYTNDKVVYVLYSMSNYEHYRPIAMPSNLKHELADLLFFYGVLCIFVTFSPTEYEVLRTAEQYKHT